MWSLRRENRDKVYKGPILPGALSRPEIQRTQAAGICKADGCQKEGAPEKEPQRPHRGLVYRGLLQDPEPGVQRVHLHRGQRVARLDFTVLRAQRGWEAEFQWATNEESHGMPRTLRETVLRWEKISP